MTTNSEREAFERWANRISEHSIITTLEDDVYVHRDARIAWAAWQAARRTPSPRSVDGEADWRIAFFDRHNEAAKAKGYHGIAEVVEQAKTITLRDELGEIARPAPAAVCACGPYCQDLGHGNCRYATANSAEGKAFADAAMRSGLSVDPEPDLNATEIATHHAQKDDGVYVTRSAEGKAAPEESAVAYVNADELASLIRDAKKFGKTKYCIDAFAKPAGFNTTPLYDHAGRVDITSAIHRVTKVLSEWEALPEDETHRDDMLHAVQEAMINATASKGDN